MSNIKRSQPFAYHFLVIPEFSYLGLLCALEPLRIANHFRPSSYSWHLLSVDGNPVVATNGMMLQVEGSFKDATDVGVLLVVSGFNTLLYFRPEIGNWLRSTQRKGAVLGGVDGGTFVLAEAQVLNDEPVALHWESHSPFTERYPKANLSRALFEINSRFVTCAGGTASIDMMLELIQRRHGRALATRISDWVLLGRIRSADDHQRLEAATRYGLHNPKAIQVVELMQEHVEDPLEIADLARTVGLTCRHLERLFSTYLGTTPSLFYLNLRLDRARELLQQTALSVTEISVACGFNSASYFSRAYGNRFKISPRYDRFENARQVLPKNGKLLPK